MTGYTRQSTYSDGDTILAADSNNEFDAIEITMAAGTGHAHDNNSGQGAYVPLISNVANSRKVEVTASGALTTGDHQMTGQIISDSGPITATLGNIVATAGSVDATAGAVTAGTTVTAGTGITSTTGNIDATAGAVTAGTTITAATGATVTSGNLAVSSGNITVSGTVDGRDVSVDGTKLDGIETAATADQTAADIRALGFFDITNDGAGSGLDADLLEGSQGIFYDHEQFGLGTFSIGTDWDTLSNNVFNSSSVNGPIGATTAIGANFQHSSLSNISLQLAGRNGAVYQRANESGTFTPWREIYHEDNILGTVSQSAGVPTGAIIETATNANGRYTRYADGTLICSVGPLVTSFINSSNLSVTWTYPSVFISNPRVYATGEYEAFSTTFRSTSHFAFARTIGTTSASIGFGSNSGWISGDEALGDDIFGLAVGRWF